ncbi:MAG TPA: hypothetical protein VFX25_27925, partial [Streptosporangiaceae bacterium]|nr:hypothetical protein [Streptosporangiaceae bacterium]
LAAIALAASAVAYLALASPLAWTVYLSGPLLLAWIAATGAWLTFGTALTPRPSLRPRRPGRAPRARRSR